MRRGVRLGVDVGSVRIGVARCDPEGLLATPLSTVVAGESAVDDLAVIAAEEGAIEIIVGLPLSLSGAEGPAAAKARTTDWPAGTSTTRPELASCTSKAASPSVETGAAPKNSKCSCASGQPAARAVPSTASMKPLGPQT